MNEEIVNYQNWLKPQNTEAANKLEKFGFSYFGDIKECEYTEEFEDIEPIKNSDCKIYKDFNWWSLVVKIESDLFVKNIDPDKYDSYDEDNDSYDTDEAQELLEDEIEELYILAENIISDIYLKLELDNSKKFKQLEIFS